MTETQERAAERPSRITSGGPVEAEVRANGIRLRYLDWSGPASPTFPPTVLLHGLLQTKEGMANLASHLARRGRVVVPDLRGRGSSDQPETGYDPATMADDVAALIEGVKLDRPVVLGRLHGGLIAYHLAARRPDLVRGLILGDTAPEVDEARAARALAVVRGLPPRFSSLEEALDFYQGTLRLSEARARHDIPHDLSPDESGGYRWRHNLTLVERIEGASMPRADWDAIARVRCPTLLLRGQRGEVPREMADRFCQTIHGCQVQTVLGARHDVFLGPGCEQTFGAVDLFLMCLCEASDGRQANLAVAVEEQEDGSQLPLPGAESITALDHEAARRTPSVAEAIERIVRAVNSRDAEAVVALFAPDGRIVQFGEGGLVRQGGLEAARTAFARVFEGQPGVAMEARDIVVSGDRAACVFAVRDMTASVDDEAAAILAPAFLTVRDGRLVEFVSYNLHVPASHA